MTPVALHAHHVAQRAADLARQHLLLERRQLSRELEQRTPGQLAARAPEQHRGGPADDEQPSIRLRLVEHDGEVVGQLVRLLRERALAAACVQQLIARVPEPYDREHAAQREQRDAARDVVAQLARGRRGDGGAPRDEAIDLGRRVTEGLAPGAGLGGGGRVSSSGRRQLGQRRIEARQLGTPALDAQQLGDRRVERPPLLLDRGDRILEDAGVAAERGLVGRAGHAQDLGAQLSGLGNGRRGVVEPGQRAVEVAAGDERDRQRCAPQPPAGQPLQPRARTRSSHHPFGRQHPSAAAAISP